MTGLCDGEILQSSTGWRMESLTTEAQGPEGQGSEQGCKGQGSELGCKGRGGEGRGSSKVACAHVPPVRRLAEGLRGGPGWHFGRDWAWRVSSTLNTGERERAGLRTSEAGLRTCAVGSKRTKRQTITFGQPLRSSSTCPRVSHENHCMVGPLINIEAFLRS